MRPTAILCAAVCAGLLPAAASACAPAPDAVVTLDYGSRYVADDASRSTVDDESNEAVNAALRPVDDFIQDLARDANAVLEDGAEAAELAACVGNRISAWAEADALSDLDSFAANLSVGARIAGIAEAWRQVRPYAGLAVDGDAIEGWLTERARQQVDFWETEATSGARVGNLRAWAAYGVRQVGDLTGDDGLRMWGYASAVRILCTAREDGSLPQETKRGRYGLHYQLHAITPLVSLAAWADRDGIDIVSACDAALPRVIDYAVRDLAAEGALTEAYAGKPQSYFDGGETLRPHEMAWLAPWLSLRPDSPLSEQAAALPRLSNSKIGGDQTLIWPEAVN